MFIACEETGNSVCYPACLNLFDFFVNHLEEAYLIMQQYLAMNKVCDEYTVVCTSLPSHCFMTCF